MITRTNSKQVEFRRPFLLSGFERVQPAGTFTVVTEEELIESLSFPAWRRTATTLQIIGPGTTEHMPIDPLELHEALMRDGAQPNVFQAGFVSNAAKRNRVRDATRTSPVGRKAK